MDNLVKGLNEMYFKKNIGLQIDPYGIVSGYRISGKTFQSINQVSWGLLNLRAIFTNIRWYLRLGRALEEWKSQLGLFEAFVFIDMSDKFGVDKKKYLDTYLTYSELSTYIRTMLYSTHKKRFKASSSRSLPHHVQHLYCQGDKQKNAVKI